MKSVPKPNLFMRRNKALLPKDDALKITTDHLFFWRDNTEKRKIFRSKRNIAYVISASLQDRNPLQVHENTQDTNTRHLTTLYKQKNFHTS